MNLGSANLKHVNSKLPSAPANALLSFSPQKANQLTYHTASRPQLQHTDSKRSIAASDDYYSLSDPSEPSSSDEKTTVIRYQTPPLRAASAEAHRDTTRGQESPLHTLRVVSTVHEAPEIEKVEEKLPVPEKGQVPRKPMSPEQIRNWRQSRLDPSPPTPGNDDTPYIQFAIDQLTRDEELLGRSRVGAESPAVSALSEDVEPHRQNEKNWLDRALEERPRQPEAAATVGRTRSISPVSAEHVRDSGQPLIPANPPRDNFRYPPLTFVPGPLRLLPLATFALCCAALIALLIVSSAWASSHDGLWVYDGVGTSRYFLFQYLPQFLSALIIIWLHFLQAAIQRILPFALLSRKGQVRNENVFDGVPLYVTNHLTPNVTLLRRGEALLQYASFVFWLSLFTVPLASSLYQTRHFVTSDQGTWMWTTVQPVAIILAVLYALLIVAIACTYIRFHRYPTGLKWDPISLADIYVLLRRSSGHNSMRSSQHPGFLGSRPASLGYWEEPSNPGNVFHGIAAGHSPSHFRMENGKAVAYDYDDLEAQGPAQASTFESWHSNRSSKISQPRFLRATHVILFGVIAVVLLVAFLAATFTHSALVNGFLPLLPSANSETASFSSFSPANFLYSFLPAFLATLLPLFWSPIDTAFRYLQPFAALSSRSGTDAESSFLLSYPAEMPILVSIHAAMSGHFRVAWFSLLSTFSWAIPILAGGIFTAQFVLSDDSTEGQILMRADPSGLYALVTFVTLYALSWTLIWPGKSRIVNKGVDVRYLGGLRETASEKLLRDDVWREPRSRRDLVTRLIAGDGLTGGTRGRWGLGRGRVVRL